MKFYTCSSIVMFCALVGKAYANAPQTKETCESIFDTAVKPYVSLYQKLDPSQKADPEASVVKMIGAARSQCQDSDERAKLIDKISAGISDHASRIGVILPITGPRATEGNAIVAGIRALYPYRGINYEDRVVVRDSRGSPAVLEAQLAELVFKHQVGLVIGGFTKIEANTLQELADQLRTPAIILDSGAGTAMRSQVFHVYPSEATMSQALAAYAKSRGFKKVALLFPLTPGANGFSMRLKDSLEGRGIDASMSYGYNPSDFSTMNDASERIFKIDRVARQGEYQELVGRAKRKAREAHMPFKPSMVALPPIVEVDAIFIDDNFRSVRHFAKLFKYLGVDKMTLLGTGQWRANGLTEPYDKFLDGATFADYIGSYQDLPKGIRVAESGSRYLIDPELSSQVDYNLIGYKAALVSDQALSMPVVKRYVMFKRLESLAAVEPESSKTGRSFDESHRYYWPAHLFQVTGGQILPLHGPGEAKQAVLPTEPTKN